MAYYLNNYLLRPGENKNEVVFDGPVTLKYLKKIVVPKGKRKGILREIKSKRVISPTGEPWKNIIEER